MLLYENEYLYYHDNTVVLFISRMLMFACLIMMYLNNPAE